MEGSSVEFPITHQSVLHAIFGNRCRNAWDRRQRKPKEQDNDNALSGIGKPIGIKSVRSGSSHGLFDEDPPSFQ